MSKPADNPIEHRRSVLVVEDELFIAMELKAALSEAGFRILGPVGSVRDALDLIMREKPDAAVLDVNLGCEKATPIADRLVALDVPFVLASASDAAELAPYESLAGARNLGKPTNLANLIDAIRSF